MIKTISVKSKCCNAKVKIIGKITMFYLCTKCKNACDIIFINRKMWNINPATKIKKSKKLYDRKKGKRKLNKQLKERLWKN